MEGYISFLYNSKFANIEISKETLEILMFFIDNHELSAYQIYKILRKNDEKISYKNTHKKINNLLKLRLVEKTREEFHQHGSIFFKLSRLGLLYILSLGNKNFLRLGALERFKDDMFFNFFVWPYFSSNTIFNLKSETHRNNFLEYFAKICDEIKTNFKRLDEVMEHDKYVDVHVIYWSEFSRASRDEHCSDTINGYLLYLKENFDIDLMNNDKDVNIEISSNDRIILFFENDKLELIKDDTLHQVKLLYNNEVLETYSCKKLSVKNYQDYQLFLRLDISVKFYLDNMISNFIPEKIREFIKELSLSVIEEYEYNFRSKLSKYILRHDKEILKKDAKFIKVLNETKSSFDLKFEEFMRKNT
jgi:hypothetical protein